MVDEGEDETARWWEKEGRFGTQQERKDHYFRLFGEQKGKCAICGKHQADDAQTFHVDHNHATGHLRELLCHHCNVILGLAYEDTSILQKCIKYLEKHS